MKRIFRSICTRNMASSSSLLQNRVNVLGKPLIVHSTNPITGYFRNGFCDTDSRFPLPSSVHEITPAKQLTPDSDVGNHTIAGVVSDKFLDFSASRGNDLRSVGLKGGCRWCLCVNRWKEAFTAYKNGKIDEETVPRVNIEATHVRALEGGVTVDQLNEFALGKQNLHFLLAGPPEMEKLLV